MKAAKQQVRNVTVHTERKRPYEWIAYLGGPSVRIPGQSVGHGEYEAQAVYDLYMQIEAIELDELENVQASYDRSC